MRQTTITGVVTGVAEGMARDPQTGEQKPIRVAVVVDPTTEEQFHFPMPPEQAEEWGAQLKGEQAEARPDIVVPERAPTKEELEVMAKAAEGKIQ